MSDPLAGYNPHIMHAPISDQPFDYEVQLHATPASLAAAFQTPEDLVRTAWVTDETPLPLADIQRALRRKQEFELNLERCRREACREDHALSDSNGINYQDADIRAMEKMNQNAMNDASSSCSVNPRALFLVLRARLNASKEAIGLEDVDDCNISTDFARAECGWSIDEDDADGDFVQASDTDTAPEMDEDQDEAEDARLSHAQTSDSSAIIRPTSQHQRTDRTRAPFKRNRDLPASAFSSCTADVRVSNSGFLATRSGQGVYRGVRLSRAVDVDSLFNEYQTRAAYVEIEVEAGSGVCIGVGSDEGRLDRLIGTQDAYGAVGFHDTGRIVRGLDEWVPYFAPYRGGDIVGVLVVPVETAVSNRTRGDRIAETEHTQDANSSVGSSVTNSSLDSAAGDTDASIADNSSSPTSTRAIAPFTTGGGMMKQFLENAIVNTAAARAKRAQPGHGVAVTFFVNGIPGEPVLLASPPARLAVAVSLYSNKARVRAHCCEHRWKYFARAARVARPAIVTAHCEKRPGESDSTLALENVVPCPVDDSVARKQSHAVEELTP